MAGMLAEGLQFTGHLRHPVLHDQQGEPAQDADAGPVLPQPEPVQLGGCLPVELLRGGHVAVHRCPQRAVDADHGGDRREVVAIGDARGLAGMPVSRIEVGGAAAGPHEHHVGERLGGHRLAGQREQFGAQALALGQPVVAEALHGSGR